MSGARTARLEASPFDLLRNALGDPLAFGQKLRGLQRTFARFGDTPAYEERMRRLQEKGFFDQRPTRLQLLVGTIDMWRFWVVPASDDYYKKIGISFPFHQLLRFLDEPASLADPTGFFSERDTIIGHVLQVVHANPHYDLQLLESFDDGVGHLERQTRAMLRGDHPRAGSIGAIVEEPDYHRRLLDYVIAYQADPEAQAPRRSNVEGSATFRALSRTFGRLDTSIRYFCRMPRTPLAAARHVLTTKTFPVHLGEPETSSLTIGTARVLKRRETCYLRAAFFREGFPCAIVI